MSFVYPRFNTPWREKESEEEGKKGPLGLRMLSASAEPLVELIFVHGLRGGSVKTWQKGSDPSLFWPQEWLRAEPEFRNVTVHSFGYDSDWGSSKPSVLNVHDFGRALYEEIRSSPWLRQFPKNPIILVGHSMGGLVIKKAYNLAHKNASHDEIAHRMRCIFFLATPHRGSDYAGVLNKVLKVSGIMGLRSSREYLDDLTKGSTSTQLINEEFGHHAHDLPIYSFYETLRMKIGVTSSIIVDESSAILGAGYTTERVRYLDANHVNICKFKHPDDSNYLTLKNTLALAISELLREVLKVNDESSKVKMRSIQSYLDVSTPPEEHYEFQQGSCQWIEDRDDFQTWRDSEVAFDKDESYVPSVYWVHAGPGAGKTMLAAHVVSLLQESQMQCAGYHFHVGTKATTSLGVFLRSIAFDMASSNAVIRDAMEKLCEYGATFGLDDARAIWSTVFKAVIFQLPICTTQYWVIDAMDECLRNSEFFSLLAGAQLKFPLRIFITSRKLPGMQTLIRQIENCPLTLVELPVKNTMQDIELFVKARMEEIPMDGDSKKEEITRKVLEKSGASFLWVRLVMDELDRVYDNKSILEVLEGIPEGMMSYYAKTVKDMAENKREKHIAKAILQWVVLASRSLTVTELSQALDHDIGANLSSPKPAIEGLCGYFLTIDPNSELVHVMHATVREFLLSEDAGEFAISNAKTHEKMAAICLRFLISPEMRPPQHWRLLEQKRPDRPLQPMVDYAIIHFSDHVCSASAESDQLLVAVDRFMSTTIMTWIEKAVKGGDLHCLIRTAKNLRGYLDRRSKYLSPLNRQVNHIDSWATDISRLATMFGKALTACPRSIHFLIPPLCPTSSAIYRNFKKSPDGLLLLGHTREHWEDCIATINFDNETAATVGCGNNLIAIGFESGAIHLYNHRSCQKELAISNNSPVELIRVDPVGAFIVASSIKFVALWGLDGDLRWKARIRSRCILLTSSASFVMCVTQQGQTLRWHASSGELLEEHAYSYQSPDFDSHTTPVPSKAPFEASISPNFNLLALAYRNAPVCIFDLQTSQLLGWAIDNRSRAAAQVIFNPNPEVHILLVAYNESHLALYDSWSGTIIQEREPEKNAVFTSVTCASDGQTFATVDIRGTLRIWDFQSLSLLYHVLTPNYSFRVLKFTSDGLSLLDVVDQQLRVWSPTALVRKTIQEETSISDQPIVPPAAEGQFEKLQSSKLECAAVHPTLPLILSGNRNGDVVASYSKTGQATSTLYKHRDAVKCLATCEGKVIASSDLTGSVQVWQFDMPQPGSFLAEKLIWNTRCTSAIHQILFDPRGFYLLVSTTEADYVYEVESGRVLGQLSFVQQKRNVWRWAAMSTATDKASRFALISDHKFTSYVASEFPLAKASDSFDLNYDLDDGFTESRINSAACHPETLKLFLEVEQEQGYRSSSKLFVFDLPEAASGPHALQRRAFFSAKLCMHFLGISSTRKRLVFLDSGSWVSSVDIESFGDGRYLRHFFVPSDLIRTSGDILPLQTADDNFVFCTYDLLAIIGHGLQFQDAGVYNGDKV